MNDEQSKSGPAAASSPTVVASGVIAPGQVPPRASAQHAQVGADAVAKTMIGVEARRNRPSTGSPALAIGTPSPVTQRWGAPGEPIQVGARIAHYELIRELGAGGMGTVYMARDIRLGRRVAIKVLQSQSPELAQRFLVEARATARCQHENIVLIYDVGEVGDHQPYMVLEYLKGGDLTRELAEGRPLALGRTIEVMSQVLRALVTAHEQGIVHRDLKPDNIFVTDTGTIKVLDFGIAKIHENGAADAASQQAVPAEQRQLAGDTGLTVPGTIMGTVKFMSPEQWGIGIEIDHRTDIWACGIILFRLLSGRFPLDPMDGNELVVTAMLDEEMPSLRTAAPHVPAELCAIVDRCLRKHKEQRFANARELLAALEPFLPGRFVSRSLSGGESPYAGLASFQESDAGRFFGRGREIAAAAAKVRERPIVAIAGPSGVGKSSFVRAGLIPALKTTGESWETLVMRPGRHPIMALAGLTTKLMGSTSTNVGEDIEEQAFQAQKLLKEPGHLGMVLRSRCARGQSKVVLFVDQFEELYTLVPDAAERRAFTAALAGAADDASAPIRVVLSLRSDFLDRVSEDPGFVAEVTAGLFFLGTPTKDGMREALVSPAEMAGYTFETPMVVDDMLLHLETTPGALPLLQFAASKLWDKRDDVHKHLTWAAYNDMGGISGALATHADAVVGDLPPASQALARSLVLRLVTPERTRAIVSLTELDELSPVSGEVRRLIDVLVQARLLVSQITEADGVATVELVHESLIHTWPALRRWLEETQEDAALLDQLRVAAKQWQAKGRPAGLLWRGDAADEARRFFRRGREVGLTDSQRAFLMAVVDEATRTQRRRRKITIYAGAGLVALLIAAGAALVKIRLSEQHANEQADAAHQAENEAKTALAAAQKKEQERLAAEADKSRAVADKNVIKGDLDQAYKDLQAKASELQTALGDSEKARTDAETARSAAEAAQRDAERNATAAQQAQAKAELAESRTIAAKAETDKLLQLEIERRKKLEDQLGSALVDTLDGQ